MQEVIKSHIRQNIILMSFTRGIEICWIQMPFKSILKSLDSGMFFKIDDYPYDPTLSLQNNLFILSLTFHRINACDLRKLFMTPK